MDRGFLLNHSNANCLRFPLRYGITAIIGIRKDTDLYGNQQLADYPDCYHIDKGCLLRFNVNRNKQVGSQTVQLGDKTIFEAVV